MNTDNGAQSATAAAGGGSEAQTRNDAATGEVGSPQGGSAESVLRPAASPPLTRSSPQPSKPSRRRGAASVLKWLVPLVFVAGAVGFRLMVTGREQVPPETPPIPVRTMRPEHGDVTRLLALNAHIESETMVTILPLVSGVLRELPVTVGQHIQKGQIVARVDAQRYELQAQQAEAAYLSAKSSYERLAQLYKANAATQQSYEQARGQYEAYQSQYELAKIQLDYATVRSPVDGVILMRHGTPGEIAAPERPLVTIGDLGSLMVKARVPERYYETFLKRRDAMVITITRPGGGEYRGQVVSISPFVSAETKNFEVVVAIQGALSLLRPGMFVAIAFELERWKDAYSLPFEALTGGRVWWVEDGTARSEVFQADRASDTSFLVPDEWAERDFIIEGQYFAREGSAVSVVGSR